MEIVDRYLGQQISQLSRFLMHHEVVAVYDHFHGRAFTDTPLLVDACWDANRQVSTPLADLQLVVL